MRSFSEIESLTISKFSSKSDFEALLPQPSSDEQLINISDAEYLSTMERRIFQAGMNHSVVNKRWAAFETIFWGFDPHKCVLISDEQYEAYMQDERLIRHWTKMKTIASNSQAMLDIEEEFGSFGRFINQYDESQTIALWMHISKRFSRMGGNSASYFLRMMGKDTFILTDDVTTALIREEVVDKKPTSKSSLKQVQEAFSQWHIESKRPLSQISKILALSIG